MYCIVNVYCCYHFMTHSGSKIFFLLADSFFRRLGSFGLFFLVPDSTPARVSPRPGSPRNRRQVLGRVDPFPRSQGSPASNSNRPLAPKLISLASAMVGGDCPLPLLLLPIQLHPSRNCLPPPTGPMLFYSFFKTLLNKDVVVELKNDVMISGQGAAAPCLSPVSVRTCFQCRQLWAINLLNASE